MTTFSVQRFNEAVARSLAAITKDLLALSVESGADETMTKLREAEANVSAAAKKSSSGSVVGRFAQVRAQECTLSCSIAKVA